MTARFRRHRHAFLAQCDEQRRCLGVWNGHTKTRLYRNATAKAISRDVSSAGLKRRAESAWRDL